MTDFDSAPLNVLPGEYGILDAEGMHSATREELIARCREGPIPRLVWTPETRGPVPPEDVPFLLQVIRDRLAGGAKTQAIIVGAIVGVLGLQWYQAGDLYVGSPSLVYLAFGVIWAGLRVREWNSARRLTPQGFRDLMRQTEETVAVQRTPVVYLRWLVGMIAVVGVAQLLAHNSGAPQFGVLPGSMDDGAIQGGEVWRLLTCGFLHGGLIHFGVNFMALLAVGRETEVLAQRPLLPIVFLAAVVAGALASFLAPPGNPSVGSSGGLMGLIGFLGVLGYRRREAVPGGFLNMVVLNIVVIAGIGILGFSFVDNAAHAGGLAAGVLLGALFIPTTRSRPTWTAGRAVTAAGAVSMAILALGCAWTVFLTLAPVL